MVQPVDSLPDYKKPPVVEVVIGLRYRSLENLTTAHYGIFWSIVKQEYPLYEDRPPLGEETEEPRFEVVQLPPLRRVFMVHTDQSYLMQVQPDRFLHNWRKLSDSAEYPHFGSARQKFMRAWDTFRDFATKNNLGRPHLLGYEVTYVNHFIEKPGAFPKATAIYLPVFQWASTRPDYFLPWPDSLSMDLRFPLPDARGRLRLKVKHGKRQPDGSDVMQAELTAAGPAKEDGADMASFLDLAHEWIVRGFTDLTSADAHAKWERVR